MRQSKNFSSRRDLKELIFVDQKAFAANIDFLNNASTKGKKSPLVDQKRRGSAGKRQETNQSAQERQSSRTQRRRNANETPSVM